MVESRVVEGFSGRRFEDFVIGDIYRHPLGRTITATDNAWFTLLTMNTNQLHFNDHYSQTGEFGKQLVVSTLTLSIVTGLSVADVSQNAVANLAWNNIQLTAPVFIGDTLYAESIVTALRESKSRPHVGIVSVHTRGLNQDGTIVLSFDRTVMVSRRDAPQGNNFPQAATPIEAVLDRD